MFFCEAHILDVGGTGGSLAPQHSFIAITVLFLVTQVRFWSLVPLQKTKKHKPEDRTEAVRPTARSPLGLRNDFLSSPAGEKLFSLVHLKLPKDRRYQFRTSATATQNAQRTWNF